MKRQQLPSLCEQWKVGTAVMDYDSDLIFFSWVYARVLLEEINFSQFLPRCPTSLFSCFGRHRFFTGLSLSHLFFADLTLFVCKGPHECYRSSSSCPSPAVLTPPVWCLIWCSGNLPWLKGFNYGTSPLLVYNVLMDPSCTMRMD